MALTLIEQVRLEIGDTDQGLPILSDEEYTYFLNKNSNSIRRSALDAAKTILFKLSINSTDETVDILSFKGAKATAAYKEALTMFIRDPNLNPLFTSVNAYAGGISKSDYNSNINNTDNLAVVAPFETIVNQNSNPFTF